MATNIEVTDGRVLRDGEELGNVVDGKFVPMDGLHPKTVTMVENHLAELDDEKPKAEKPKKNAEPTPGEAGDIDPALIKWRHENWDEARFNELYPASRLAKIGITL